jgi:hypothetical protein
VTERKPPGMSFESWIDQQISAAAERGAFDDLPGAGKPLPKRDDFDGQAWLADYVRREGGSVEDCLPTPLRLRKESERLANAVPALRSEDEVRAAVDELNERIRRWRRIPFDGPPIFVPLVDAEVMIARWRQARVAVTSPPDPDPGPGGRQPVPREGRKLRWRRRAR